MNTEHTAGPWNYNANGDIFIADKKGKKLVQLASVWCAGTTGLSNTRLIAAAPEFLEALKDCQVQLADYVAWHQKRGGCSVEIESAEEQARLAIARATGEAKP